jgi:pimeloyl-ACP methyl ester carboxylesterase
MVILWHTSAMVYARQHPESVRTMILDGVVPLDWILGPTVAGDAQQALNLIFGQCKVEKACSEAFPNIENEFQAILERLRDKPVHFSLSHPSSGEIVEMTLTLESFVNTVHMMSYAPETVSLLPMMIHQAYSYDDFSALAAQTLSTTERLTGLISTGMRFSVICSEDQPFYTQEPSSEGYLGNQFENAFNDMLQSGQRNQ